MALGSSARNWDAFSMGWPAISGNRLVRLPTACRALPAMVVCAWATQRSWLFAARRARIRELFPDPAGPPADIEVEDQARGKVKRVSMWTAVGNLVPSGAPPHLVARTASKMRQGVGESELQYITLRHGRDSHHLANEASHCLR